ncbi:MAG: glycosyltransferase family 9 protein [Myxococcota bacterium]
MAEGRKGLRGTLPGPLGANPIPKPEHLDGGLARFLDTWGGLAICAVFYLHSRLASYATGTGRRLPPMRATTPPNASVAPIAKPKRILTIKTYGLGNVAILMPVLARMRRAYPDAIIDMLTLEGNCDLVERTGLIDETISLRLGGIGRALVSIVGILRKTRRRHYDLVVDFEQFIKLSTVIAYWSGAPERIGFNTDGQRRGWLYTKRVVYTDSQHMSGIFSRLLQPLDLDPSPAPFDVATRPEEERAVERFLQDSFGEAEREGPLVAVHVGSGPNFYDVPLKRWPVESFASLADSLIDRYGARIVFTGKGDEEDGLIEKTLEQMRSPENATSACDRLSVGELLAFLRRADLAVSNDTSVMHLSAVVGTPVVAFFGPTNPLQYGPLDAGKHLVFYDDLYCSPCITNYNLKVSYCSDPVCIRGITVERVLAGIERDFLGEEARVRALVEG